MDLLEKEIEKIEKELMKEELQLIEIEKLGKEIVRLCGKAIKFMHEERLEEAENFIGEAKKQLGRLESLGAEHPERLRIVYQEYGEAEIVLAVLKNKPIPKREDLSIPSKQYVGALLDSIGEIKRSMYERLRKRRKEEAEGLFNIMEGIFDSLLSLKFSNAVIPDFRRKQDAARIQIEQARGMLL